MFSEFKKKNAPAILINKTNIITYGKIREFSENFKFLVKEGSFVIFMIDNSPESLMIYFALLNHHVCVLPIEPNSTKETIDNFILRFKPLYIIKHIKKDYHHNDYQINKEFISFNILKNSKNKINYNFDENLKILLTTSGSSGDPKCAMITKKSLLSNTQGIVDYLNLDTNDSTVTTMPASYSYGISVINSHFYVGGSIISNEYSPTQKQFWDIFGSFNVSNLNGVPFFYNILNKLNLDKLKLVKGLTFLTQAGGSLDLKLFNDIKNYIKSRKIDFFKMYGQTEASPRMSYCKINKLNHMDYPKPSIGKAINKCQLYLKDEHDNTIDESDKVGEIVFKGENIFSGYALSYQDMLKTKKIDALYTGDLGYKNREGDFYITGRKSRVMKLYGLRFDLDHISSDLRKKTNSNVFCDFHENKLFVISDKQIKVKSFYNIPIKDIKFLIVKKIPILANGKVDFINIKKIIKNNENR